MSMNGNIAGIARILVQVNSTAVFFEKLRYIHVM